MNALTLQQAAKYIGVNRHQMERYVREQLIAVIRVPYMKRVRFRVEDLDQFLEAYRVPPKWNAVYGPEPGPKDAATESQIDPELARNPRANGSTKPRNPRPVYRKGWELEGKHAS